MTNTTQAFNPEEYEKELTYYYKQNSHHLDIFLFIINTASIFIHNDIFSKALLILLLCSYLISKTGCIKGLEKRYKQSNALFSMSDFMGYFIFALTLINIVA